MKEMVMLDLSTLRGIRLSHRTKALLNRQSGGPVSNVSGPMSSQDEACTSGQGELAENKDDVGSVDPLLANSDTTQSAANKADVDCLLVSNGTTSGQEQKTRN